MDVPKKDGIFQIYKVTINQVLAVDQYPLHKPEHLFATLAGGKVFTKLDLSQVYLQLLLDEKSSIYVTINTHQGLYKYNRLPFGVASAPALFHKLMDRVLQGQLGPVTYTVKVEDGKTIKRHVDHIRERMVHVTKFLSSQTQTQFRIISSTLNLRPSQSTSPAAARDNVNPARCYPDRDR